MSQAHICCCFGSEKSFTTTVYLETIFRKVCWSQRQRKAVHVALDRDAILVEMPLIQTLLVSTDLHYLLLDQPTSSHNIRVLLIGHKCKIKNSIVSADLRGQAVRAAIPKCDLFLKAL